MPGNALDRIARYDIVADGSDNFATRYLVSDACYLARKPLVFAAVGPFEGYITTLKPHEKAADGTPFPSYRCLFPEAPPPGTVANCAEVGVLGAAVGVLGTLQATEVLKEILGLGDSLAGRLVHLRCAILPLQRDQDRLGPGQSAVRQEPDHPRSVDPCGRRRRRRVRGVNREARRSERATVRRVRPDSASPLSGEGIGVG